MPGNPERQLARELAQMDKAIRQLEIQARTEAGFEPIRTRRRKVIRPFADDAPDLNGCAATAAEKQADAIRRARSANSKTTSSEDIHSWATRPANYWHDAMRAIVDRGVTRR